MMPLITYHASQEQFKPSHLLQLVKMAEAAGFQACHSSDHFHPWSRHQGNSGFTFSWIAAALAQTTLPFSMICTPGQRLHVAIVAQAIATLGEMFPGRVSFELASGEPLNEMITGDPWPDHAQRNARLLECAGLIRGLLQGKEISHEGLVTVREAKLYTVPATLPKLLCAAMTDDTARWAGSWADGLIITGGSREDTSRKIDLFYGHGGDKKPIYVQHSFSYARGRERAIQAAWEQWRANIGAGEKLNQFHKPQQFDAAGEQVSLEQVARGVLIAGHMDELQSSLEGYGGLPIERLILHNVNRCHEEFIEDMEQYFDWQALNR